MIRANHLGFEYFPEDNQWLPRVSMGTVIGGDPLLGRTLTREEMEAIELRRIEAQVDEMWMHHGAWLTPESIAASGKANVEDMQPTRDMTTEHMPSGTIPPHVVQKMAREQRRTRNLAFKAIGRE